MSRTQRQNPRTDTPVKVQNPTSPGMLRSPVPIEVPRGSERNKR